MAKYVAHAHSKIILSSHKVRKDIVSIASKLGYLSFESDEQNSFDQNIEQMRRDDVLLFPFPSGKGREQDDLAFLTKIKEKQVKLILITLNIDYLRYDTADKAATVSALQQADVLITLSQAMNQQLLLDGVNVPMVVLDLHDYLSEGEILPATYMKKLIFAGSPYKATYMQGWQSHIPIDIFAREEAIDHIDQLHDSISYTGYLTPDKMPNLINYGFGLAFDVDSDAGHFANYQTLNLSHKVSLFLAAGLPIIVNARAASAPILRAANAALVIDSIGDIEDIFYAMDDVQYHKLAHGSAQLGRLVRDGFFYTKAVRQAEQLIDVE